MIKTPQTVLVHMSAGLADVSATTPTLKEGKHPIHFMIGILVPTWSLGLADLLMFESRSKLRNLKWLKIKMDIHSSGRRSNYILCTILKYKDPSVRPLCRCSNGTGPACATRYGVITVPPVIAPQDV
jgi:hypothetical protein